MSSVILNILHVRSLPSLNMTLYSYIDKADDEEAMENDTPSPKSPSPVGAEGGDDDGDNDDEEDGEAGNESKPINEDWDSGKAPVHVWQWSYTQHLVCTNICNTHYICWGWLAFRFALMIILLPNVK